MFLAQVFRGQNLYVRNVDDIIRRIRDDAIRREYDAGVTVRELVSNCRLSQRSVEKIISRPDSDMGGRQLKLFK